MKSFRSAIFILLLAACNNGPEPQQAEEVPAAVTNRTDSVEDPDELYMRIGNPDTALAMFLYKNYQKFDPEEQIDEYIRWDLENKKIRPLLVSLYLKGGNKDSVLNILQKNRAAFQEKAAAKVMDEYKQYSGVSGQLFAYLVEKNDPVVEPLLQDLLNNPKASKEEKEYAKKTLKELKKAAK